MEQLDRMKALKQQGFFCSQIIMQMGLDLQGRDNPALIRAMQGLAGGLGFSGDTCGALTGSACLLGVYAGKGKPEEQNNPQLNLMIEALVKWFKAGYGTEYGGIRCDEILAGNPVNQTTRCPVMVAGSFQKVKEILVENGFDLARADDDD